MRVLALAAEAFGGYGGIARSTQDLLGTIAMTKDFRIDVLPRIAREEPGRLPHTISQHAPHGGRITFSASAGALALKIRPQLVYCGHLYMVPLAAVVARLVGAKLAAHVHGLEIWQPLTAALRRGLQQCDLVYCVSQDTARRVREATSPKSANIAVVFNTVGDNFYPRDRRAARQRFGLSSETALLTVSRLDGRQRHKGHDRVIPLLSALQDAQRMGSRGDLVYLVAGDGDDRGRLERLADDMGVSQRVRFLGRVPDDLLPDLYSAADLYVMPSSGEGFGIAFVEAMSCGTPAIGLAIGGASDALCHGVLGTAVSTDEFPNALAAALSRGGPNREALSRATRERFGRPAFAARIAASLFDLFPDEALTFASLVPQPSEFDSRH